MAEFKTVIADPKNKTTYQKVLSEDKSNALVGKHVGEEIDGIFVELPGYRLKTVSYTHLTLPTIYSV